VKLLCMVLLSIVVGCSYLDVNCDWHAMLQNWNCSVVRMIHFAMTGGIAPQSGIPPLHLFKKNYHFHFWH